jgi:Na+/citrate or Na+/malate symporter
VVLLPNTTFLAVLALLVTLALLTLFGIPDLWTKRRFPSVNARIGWTAVLLIAGLPALVVYVIVVKSRSRVAIPAT